MHNAYKYDVKEGFILDRNENETSSYEKLQNLIGLDLVKKQIESIIASDIIEKERKKRKGNDYQTGTMHMVFGGNPGMLSRIAFHIEFDDYSTKELCEITTQNSGKPGIFHYLIQIRFQIPYLNPILLLFSQSE